MSVTADRCPGVLRLHEAADGALARVRLPGGLLTADQLRTLAAAADELGDGRLELTSRGNVQLRALQPGAAARLEARLTDAGLLPSRTHERVRNIVASPLAGLDLVPFVRELDRAICASPQLVELSGRFLFGLDDGSGDIAALAPDALAVVRPGDSPVEVASRLIAYAMGFLVEREQEGSDAWRVRDLRGRAAGVQRVQRPVGMVGSALVVLAPLGRLSQQQSGWLADAAGVDELRVTPWRSVVVPQAGGRDADAADVLGFGVTADSGWLTVTACAGRPGCAQALADVQHDAGQARRERQGEVVHWSGCERRCGRPSDTTVDVVATPSGYLVELAHA